MIIGLFRPGLIVPRAGSLPGSVLYFNGVELADDYASGVGKWDQVCSSNNGYFGQSSYQYGSYAGSFSFYSNSNNGSGTNRRNIPGSLLVEDSNIGFELTYYWYNNQSNTSINSAPFLGMTKSDSTGLPLLSTTTTGPLTNINGTANQYWNKVTRIYGLAKGQTALCRIEMRNSGSGIDEYLDNIQVRSVTVTGGDFVPMSYSNYYGTIDGVSQYIYGYVSSGSSSVYPAFGGISQQPVPGLTLDYAIWKSNSGITEIGFVGDVYQALSRYSSFQGHYGGNYDSPGNYIYTFSTVEYDPARNLTVIKCQPYSGAYGYWQYIRFIKS